MAVDVDPAAARCARLSLELGGDQARRLGGTLAAHGFGSTTTWTDADGDLRALVAVRGYARSRASR